MLNKLSIKLLIQNLVIGIAFIISLLFISGPVSNFSLILLFCALVVVQSIASYVFFSKILTKRLIQLKAYLDMVISTEEAPSKPLKDLVLKATGAKGAIHIHMVTVISLWNAATRPSKRRLIGKLLMSP